MEQKKLLGILVILPLAAVLLGGCPWTPKKGSISDPTPSKLLEQTSAANVLANLRQAYQDRNIDEYMPLFTSDYQFDFAPLDVQNGTVPNAFWALPDERRSTSNMFTSDSVEGIELNYVPGDTVNSDNEYTNSWKVTVSQINLRVDTRTTDGGQLTLLVPSATDVFYFRAGPDMVNGKPIWRIFLWKDEPLGGGAALASLATKTTAR